jgi:cell division transport system ATP-binding protein
VQLSGGEQQRVSLARAFSNAPRILFADEPTGNLDPEHSWEIMVLLRELNRNGTTIVVASHDMMVVNRMGERVVSLDQGRVVGDQPATSTWQDVLPLDLPEDDLDDLLKQAAAEPIEAAEEFEDANAQ